MIIQKKRFFFFEKNMLMVKGLSNTLKVANMKDNGKMVKKMDLEYILYPIGVNISVSIRKD